MKIPRATTINVLVLLVSIVILLSKSEAEVSISCPKVIMDVSPCASFLQSKNTKKPSKLCCKGIKKLDGDAGSKKDRADVCKCLKQVLNNIGKYDPKRIPQLPKECDVSVKLPPIDKNTDCSKI